MPTYLVTLSLGPVQSLIEAARRTRDLWCGSWLLSEAARAAARVLHEHQPGCLIFPCLDNPDAELLPQQRPGDEANVANILRAEIILPDINAAQAVCGKAKDAAVARLADLCDQARAEVKNLPFHEDLWTAQRLDILESFSAWVAVREGEYAVASKRLGGVLAARKATRNFIPASVAADGPGLGIPKSSLDGGRESVINVPRKERESAVYRTALRRLSVVGGEELDCLAVAKRRAGISDQFTAYSRIAADPWVAGLSQTQQHRICDAYEPLVELELATRTKGNAGIYRALPYDAQMLYDFRLENALAATETTSTERRALKTLRNTLAAIAKEKGAGLDPVGAPVPYAVVLKGDGDRMGKLLSSAVSAEQSRQVSRALHGFACAVRGIVRKHRGHAIYSGGDDVLALVPLNSAIACAQALADAFNKRMQPQAKALNTPLDEYPTFSVGLGIGQLMEPLGRLRARADLAEKDAKGDDLPAQQQRNALAITLGIRSGGEYRWRAQWTDNEAHEVLMRLTKAFQCSDLPSRVAYDLRAIDRRLAWLPGDRDDTAQGIRRSELARMLDRARIEGGNKEIPADLYTLLLGLAETQSLDRLAETLIVARWLSARTVADLGEG